MEDISKQTQCFNENWTQVKEEVATPGDDTALPDYFENVSACSPVLSEDNDHDQHFIPEPQE